MEKFKTKVLPLSKIKSNQQNPRIISESRLKKLINSILAFPRMLNLRPIVINDQSIVLGGNMRLTALGRIAQWTEDELLAKLETLPEYNELPDGGYAVREYWQAFLNRPQAEVVIADDLTEDEKKQFIIKDNVSFGDWDYEELENWDSAKLENWGVDMMPDFIQDAQEQYVEPENLVSDGKNKPFSIKIVCTNGNQLRDFAQDIMKLINEKYQTADYSVSGGEL